MKENRIVSSVDNYFEVTKRHSTLRKEIMAGIIIFISMFYIILVQGEMLGSFLYDDTVDPNLGPAVIGIITAMTAAGASIFMGVYANRPVALASGMGVNAFVAYTLIASQGMSFEAAMSAVMFSGILFIIVSITPLRRRIMLSVPNELKIAITISIGLFIMYIGLANTGIIVQGSGTITSLGNLLDPVVILALFCIGLTVILWILNIRAAILISILISIILGLIFTMTGFESESGVSGLPTLDFDTGSYVESFQHLLDPIGKSFLGLGDKSQTWANPQWYLAIFILFLNDFFDTAGMIFAIDESIKDDVEIDENTNKKFLIVDACSTTIGSVFGATNITSFSESIIGIKYGGRTGLTAITVGILFLLTIPIIPLLSPLITPSITVGALFLVGIMMASKLKDLKLDDKVYLVTSIVLIMFSILTYSIGIGIVMGLITFVVLMICTGRIKELDWILIISSPILVSFLILPLLL